MSETPDQHVPPAAPNAGTPVPQVIYRPVPNHGSATTALVLGILSLVGFGFLTGVPAIVVGRRAMREIDASAGQVGGRGLASAGFVTGLVGTILSGLLTAFLLLVFALGGMVQDSYSDVCSTINPDPILNPECF